MERRILQFRDQYDYLSNFYPASVTVDGLTYLCTEAAFQAAKCQDPAQRIPFTPLDGKKAKRRGRQVLLPPDRETVKVAEMEKVVRAKFAQNPNLAQLLIATGDTPVAEGNAWNDTFWGVSLKTGKGKNHLGLILMALRGELQITEGMGSL